MGMVGTTPASGRVLLVGDAAGLVNPLQGEGIAQAMSSGRAAAEAILGSPGRGRRRLPRASWPGPTSPISGSPPPAMPPWWADPRAVSAVGRLLTAPVVGRALAGGWGIFWNELLDGAAPGARPTGRRGVDAGRSGGHGRHRRVPLVHRDLRRRLNPERLPDHADVSRRRIGRAERCSMAATARQGGDREQEIGRTGQAGDRRAA